MKMLLWLLPLALLVMTAESQAEPLKLTLRYQEETAPGSQRYHRLTRQEEWKPEETAIIVCDVWDLHHCLNAVRRAEEFAPRLNEVVKQAREQGVTVIHAPSDCMPAYEGHPARVRAMQTPLSQQLPQDIQSWCSKIPSEEKGVYPIDQSDGGEDDDPQEHAEWAEKLAAMGRNPKLPWKMQSKLIEIEENQDYISDKGAEIWSILEQKGIKNVILTGVHTNMCVLGRPFGLRQMAKNGKNVVLMRDMTDTMYNPQRWPYVSHFTGTDLIISHIEKFVAPTITSDQFLGGKPFVFKNDERPHLVLIIGEDEYHTEKTLPEFGSKFLGKQFRVSYVFADEKNPNEFPGLSVLKDADLALISVRRRVLKPEDMELLKQFAESGKPLVGIRTASHAFSLRGKQPPEGYVAWEKFDAQVWGGNYSNHYGNNQKSTVQVATKEAHPILKGLNTKSFPQAGSLYVTSPLAEGTTLLLTGTVEGKDPEPVAWTFTRKDGGRSFYTSLGHPGDFENEQFLQLLLNGISWAAGLPTGTFPMLESRRADYENHWTLMPVPATWEAGSNGVLKEYRGLGWYRCAVRVPQEWLQQELHLVLPSSAPGNAHVWINGQKAASEPLGNRFPHVTFSLQSDNLTADDANLIVIRLDGQAGEPGLTTAPVFQVGEKPIPLKGRWQFRIGDNSEWSNMPLPAKFGASTDIVLVP